MFKGRNEGEGRTSGVKRGERLERYIAGCNLAPACNVHGRASRANLSCGTWLTSDLGCVGQSTACAQLPSCSFQISRFISLYIYVSPFSAVPQRNHVLLHFTFSSALSHERWLFIFFAGSRWICPLYSICSAASFGFGFPLIIWWAWASARIHLIYTRIYFYATESIYLASFRINSSRNTEHPCFTSYFKMKNISCRLLCFPPPLSAFRRSFSY